jgi:hypothetical protein
MEVQGVWEEELMEVLVKLELAQEVHGEILEIQGVMVLTVPLVAMVLLARMDYLER